MYMHFKILVLEKTIK